MLLLLIGVTIYLAVEWLRYSPRPYTLTDKSYVYSSVKNVARINDYHYNFYIPTRNNPQEFVMVSFELDDPIRIVADTPPGHDISVTYANRCSSKDKCAEGFARKDESEKECRKRLCRWTDGVLHVHSVNEINHVLIEEVKVPSQSSSSYDFVTSF